MFAAYGVESGSILKLKGINLNFESRLIDDTHIIPLRKVMQAGGKAFDTEPRRCRLDV